jgi:DNA-binding response OmpR family regulator
MVVSDWEMPEMTGVELCQEIRRRSASGYVYVILLTSRHGTQSVVDGLNSGADDFVNKPFQPQELVARVKALLRRADPGTPSEKPIEIGGLRIDPAAYRVTRAGKAVPMSTLEFRLLYYLASRPNRVFTRDQLLDAVWGTDRFVTPRSVDVYVRRLREKIEADPENPSHLKTVRGAGYLFETRAA